ncbi:MAG: hypothetical protein ACN6P1_18465 [Pseudomonas sp.]|uniref:hypothetical protein n=1 Tax=Pseudomonas sp. TaxID=306 RepID=UPI003D0B18B7
MLPEYQFSERHQLDIGATPDAILEAVATLDAEDDPLIRRCLQLREAPARLALKLGLRNALQNAPRFGMHSFSLLARDADQAAYGLIGRFWRSDFGLLPCKDGEAFRTFREPGVARLLLSFRCEPASSGHTRLITETRVHCPDRASRLAFTPYWLAIRPVSGLIRRRMLNGIRARVE